MGTEFRSPFSELVGMTGSFLHVIDVESPWLNGRTERSHAELRHQIELMLTEIVPQSDEEWLSVVASAVTARNASHNEKGFSPIQRVLGTTPRIAGELCMDGWPDAVYEGPLQAMRRSADIRHTANRAYLEQQHRARLRTALRTRHRKPDVPLLLGMRVWVWRKPQRGRLQGWYGPGLILVKTTSGHPCAPASRSGHSSVPGRRTALDAEGQEEENDSEDERNEERTEEPERLDMEGTTPRGDVRPRQLDETVEEPPSRRPRVGAERELPPEESPYRGTSTPVPTRPPRPTASWMGIQEDTDQVLTTFYQAEKGIVQVNTLPVAVQELFLKGSRLKESQAVMNTLVPLSKLETERVLANPQANVIPSRWLDVWKEVDKSDAPSFPQGLGIPRGLVPKSRWILQGFHDSAARELNRCVQTSEQHELLYVLQVVCDHGWTGQVGDVSAAFTQANMDLPQNQRVDEIYVRAPRDGGLPCFPGATVFRLQVELYGLMTGPLCWKNTFFHKCSQLGFVLHPLGSCTLLWYHPETKELEGIMLVQVDDVLVGGTHADFVSALERLKATFRFGKRKSLCDGSEFNGRHLQQVKHEIQVDLRDYMCKLKPIPIEKCEIDGKDRKVVTQFRALLGALSWATRAAVPQGVGDCSILASQTNSLTWADVKELNRSLGRMQETVTTMRVIQMPRKKT
eukprot:348389-Amphidinium_carterae.2